jgi:hypothetical protein
MFGSMDGENAMYLNIRSAVHSYPSINAVGSESYFRIFRAFEDFLVHLAVPHRIAAMAGGRGHDNLAAYFSGGRVISHLAALQRETSMDSMNRVAESKGDCRPREEECKRLRWRRLGITRSREQD